MTAKRIPPHKQGPKSGTRWFYRGTRGYGFVVEKSAETRHVIDRTYGGDVIYISGRLRDGYTYRCTLAEWRDWASDAKQVRQ